MDANEYNVSDRLLHRLALGVPLISKQSFELEKLTASTADSKPLGNPIFISGLARAGTTILMRSFHDTGHFRSLTYRDMPFVLMPGIWKKLSTSFSKFAESKERAHGDGVWVDFDSPEAFEEVFWRNFAGKDYIFDRCLQPHLVDSELIDQFRLYVKYILNSAASSKQLRYLSKNNNNILRLDAIRNAFPAAHILIPFRHPLQQAGSLLSQHTKFCERHSKDKFSIDYMRWLGHHEFGLTHKAFHFSGENSPPQSEYSIDTINYWLQIWINAYSYLLDKAPPNSLYICYEDLCQSPEKIIRNLFDITGVTADEKQIATSLYLPPDKDLVLVDKNLGSRAEEVYKLLQTKAEAISS